MLKGRADAKNRIAEDPQSSALETAAGRACSSRITPDKSYCEDLSSEREEENCSFGFRSVAVVLVLRFS